MKLPIFNYRCANCDAKFKDLGVLDGMYGEFVLRSETGESAYLNSFEDVVFDELSTLFEKVKLKFYKINEYREVAVFQKAFSITCDKSPDGGTYKIGRPPTCPNCGSKKMAGWLDTHPLEVSREHVPPVTHETWKTLTLQEKEIKLEREIERILQTSIIVNGRRQLTD